MPKKNYNKSSDQGSLEDEGPSKTQIKNAMLELQNLGVALIDLSVKDLDKIPLDDLLKSSILEAHRIRSNNARKRQLQYIGKLMRKADSEAIQEAYEKVINPSVEHNKRFHKLEKLRDKLVELGDPAIEDVISLFPDADRQQLRQLIRAIQKETSQNKPPAQQRKLFRYLRELSDAQLNL